MKIQGTFTALITPFKNDSIDQDGFRENLRFQIENGIDGIVVLGTTGESPTLTSEEEKILVHIAVEEAKGIIPIVVGTGTNATSSTMKKTALAKEWGADAALIITPYYNRPSQEGIYQHYAAINQSVPFPIFVYNNPRRTAVDIDIETLKKIAELPHVYGIKEASGNLLQMQEEIQATSSIKPFFSVVSGDDLFTYPLLTMGGSGVISTAGNLIPREMKSMTDAKTLEEAKIIQAQLLPLFQALSLEVNPIPIKTAMSMCGMSAGLCRLPLTPMQPKNQEKLRTILDHLDLSLKTSLIL